MTAAGQDAPTLTEFLLARIAEDEAAARAHEGLKSWTTEYVEPEPPSQFGRWTVVTVERDRHAPTFAAERVAQAFVSFPYGAEQPTVEHIARHDPARVLAECEAKRRWIDLAHQHAATIDGEWGCCHDAETLRRGYREAEGDWDEDEPIPDSCYGIKAVAEFLAPLAAVYADHPDHRPKWRP